MKRKKRLLRERSRVGQPIILMSREQSAMASGTWNQMLCVKKLPKGEWSIGNYIYDMIGIHDVALELLDKKTGKLRIPKKYKRVKFRGITEDCFQMDELFAEAQGIKFNSSHLQRALEWCSNEGWDSCRGFDEAWKKLTAIVSQEK